MEICSKMLPKLYYGTCLFSIQDSRAVKVTLSLASTSSCYCSWQPSGKASCFRTCQTQSMCIVLVSSLASQVFETKSGRPVHDWVPIAGQTKTL
eukprot:scaffold304276_cov35-Attheya_sp.AAC.1